MLTLYHCDNARSFRPLWTLEEMGLPYTLKMLPFPPRQLAPDYLTVNPLGTVPTLLDGSMRMTESAAICQYIVTRYGPTPLAVEPSEPDFGPYLNWLHFGEATLTFPQTIVLRYTRLEPLERRLPQAVADYTKWTLGRFAGLEKLMAGAEYVAADRFTVADISVGYALMVLKVIGLFDQAPASLQAYYGRLRERPGFRRAKAAQKHAASEKGVGPTLPPEKLSRAT
jgi:glutathione S-transferase